MGLNVQVTDMTSRDPERSNSWTQLEIIIAAIRHKTR